MREENWTENEPPRITSSSGDQSCRFCGRNTETVQYIICCCEALARQRSNVLGSLVLELTDICTVSVRDLCLFIEGTGLWSLGWIKVFRVHNKPWAAVLAGRLRRRALEEKKEKEKKNSGNGIIYQLCIACC
jgi:hypothetical protein